MCRPIPAVCRAVVTGAAIASALVSTSVARADVFVLKHGGRVYGTWLNPEAPPAAAYAVRMEDGGEIHFDRESIAQVIRPSSTEQQYEALRRTSPDTVAGHWWLAEWCGGKRLERQRHVHLDRILELDPEHAAARQAKGHRQVDGQWMTRDEEMALRGLTRYRGQYRTQQDIELQERQRKARVAEREWFKKLKRWCNWLVGNNLGRVELAQENIQAIRDPWAVPALADHLQRNPNRPIRLLLIEALARVAMPKAAGGSDGGQVTSPKAVQVLVDQSLYDPDQEVRLACLDRLVDMHHPEVTGLYVRALKSKSNLEINRAAVALKALGDPAAISPLIDALITTHKVKVGSGNPGQTTASFSPGKGGNIGFGRSGPTVTKVPVRNREVLSALVAISGANFEYHVADWNAWYAAQRRSRGIDARRD